jgi:antitoxin ParD1/3/4
MISAELGPQLESLITRLVESGRYGSKSEVLREGVRLIQERERRLEALLATSLAEAEAGLGQPAEAVFDNLERKYREQIKV